MGVMKQDRPTRRLRHLVWKRLARREDHEEDMRWLSRFDWAEYVKVFGLLASKPFQKTRRTAPAKAIVKGCGKAGLKRRSSAIET